MKLEENRHIYLPLGDVSGDEELGIYYIDMRPARVHYEGVPNIWGGQFDENGVPMIRQGNNLFYYPINLAQFGFMIHADWKENPSEETLSRMKSVLEVLESLKTEDENIAVWWHREPHYKYGLQPPWASAMAQGEIISFYLRLYQILQNESLLKTAKRAYQYMKIPVKDGGIRQQIGDGYDWLEEYPSSPPSLVLNGFVYALFGLYDLHRITKDHELKLDIDQLIESLIQKLPEYSTRYWSLYDLQKKELVRYYYQKNVHVPQMKVLYALTGKEIFNDYAQKWEGQVNWLNFQFVKIMYRVRPRWQRILKLKIR